MSAGIPKTSSTCSPVVKTVTVDADEIENMVTTHRDNKIRLKVYLNSFNKKNKGYHGVQKVVIAGKYIYYRAVMQVHGRCRRGTTHKTPEEAAIDADMMAIDVYGKDAVLNFPDRKEEYLRKIKEGTK